MKTKTLSIEPIVTDIYSKDMDLNKFIESHLGDKISNGDVLAISSKIISISEDRFCSKTQCSKEELIKKESDHFLGEIGHGVYLTIKHGLLIPSAGIDESNATDDKYLLYPVDPFLSAKKIWQYFVNSKSLSQFGVVFVDSHSSPLRRGTTGISLAHWGFKAVKDYRGSGDLYNSTIKHTFLNIVDSLASSANMVMGEANEQTPLALIHNANVVFSPDTNPSEVKIDIKKDLYYPIYKNLLK